MGKRWANVGSRVVYPSIMGPPRANIGLVVELLQLWANDGISLADIILKRQCWDHRKLTVGARLYEVLK